MITYDRDGYSTLAPLVPNLRGRETQYAAVAVLSRSPHLGRLDRRWGDLVQRSTRW